MNAQICYDWSPLGYASNPVPGDPELVQSSATTFRQTATRLSEAATGLRRLDDSDLESDATQALWSNAREIEGLLTQAFDRYDKAAHALGGYAPVLARSQAEAVAALQAASSASSDCQRASRNAHDLWWAAKTTIDPEDRAQFIQAFHQAKSQADMASSNVYAARAKVEAAITARDTGANNAARQIHDAISGRELNDDVWDQLNELWESVKQFTADLLANNPWLKSLVDGIVGFAKFVWDHIGEIALVLQIASLLLGWVPVLGQVLIFLAAVAKVIAIVKTVVDLGTAFAKGVSTGDWSTFAIEALMLGISYVAGKGISKFFDAKRLAPMKDAFNRTVSSQGYDKALAAVGRSYSPSPWTQVKQFLTIAPASGSRQSMTDSLISNLKNSGQYVKDLEHQVIKNDIVEEGADYVKDKIIDQAKPHDPAPPDHRICTQSRGAAPGSVR